ncbi:MAG: tubulin-like doman-containing protein [Lachnospiraceae bacterium]|nr:tubulin-like doman-containing protein [Lachnospiraceae bacterium]
MKLSSISRSEMGKILEIGMVDTGSDILFPDLHRCDIRNDKLYLIIGIGGSGMAMLKETKRLADRRLNPGYEPFMKFLAVDAAPSELQVVEGLGIPTLNFLIPGAAERLRKENRSDFFKKFVPLDYDLKKLTGEGGAADRVTGKIRLYDTHGNTTNDKLFVQRIQSLFYESQNLLPDYYSVNIVILSGTTGGMGSGAFLDLAVRAKAAFPDPGRVQVYGCLMLPDTLRYKSFLADMQMLSGLYGNGYAALKELERYMCICLANDGRTVVLEAPDPQDNVTLSASNLPFDCPFLLSGKFEEAVSTAAELIINLAVNHHDDIGLEARITHLDWARQNLLADGTLRQNVFSEDSHAYLNVGYAYAAIPQTTAVSFVIGSVGKRLYLPDGAGKSLGESGWRALFFRENGINKTDFEKQVRFLLVLDDESPLQGDSFWKKIRAKIQECCRPGESEQEITYRDLQYGNVGDYLRGFHIKEAADEVIRQMTEELERFYREFLHRAESIMEEFGPGMMVRLYEGYGNKDEEGRWEDFSEICIKTQIKEVVVGLNMVKQIPVEYPESNISQENRQPLFSYKRNMIVEEWKGRAKAAAGADIKRRVSADMLEAVNEWYERIKYFVFRCERFAAVLETLTEFYVNRGNAAADSLSRVFVDEMNQPNMLNLCSVPEVS